jgi:aryl-alcohol dehydrogenase-like predicted oxidoreductase
MKARLEGKIRLLGATNFDSEHIRRLVEQGVPLVSLQAQYSLLDRRPEKRMTGLSGETGVWLLPYGVLAGGFLSGKYLGCRPPGAVNRSLTKYRLVIEDAGGWEQFQELLRVLSTIGSRHSVPLELVAARWVLDRPAVRAIILGTGTRSRAAQNLALADLELDEDDRQQIQGALDRMAIPAGDMYDLERDENSAHSGIIKTDLQQLQT